MALFSKARSILKQSLTNHIHKEFVASAPSIYQAIRCMSSKLFFGGISFNMDETTLREECSKYGEVIEARIIVDRETGNSRGFGFVTFASAEDASSAIQALDQKELHGRTVRVNYANDKPRGYGGGGGNYGGGGGYGGGNYGGGGGGYGGGNYGGGGYGGGNYGGGGGGSYGGGNYGGRGSGGGSYGGGNYGGGSTEGDSGYNSGGNNYTGGGSGGVQYPSGNQNLGGVATGGGGVSDSYIPDVRSGGTGGGGDQFGDGDEVAYNKSEGNFDPQDNDDDDGGDYVDKRA